MNLDTLLIVINSWWPDALVEAAACELARCRLRKTVVITILKKRPRLRPFFLQATVLSSLNLY